MAAHPNGWQSGSQLSVVTRLLRFGWTSPPKSDLTPIRGGGHELRSHGQVFPRLYSSRSAAWSSAWTENFRYFEPPLPKEMLVMEHARRIADILRRLVAGILAQHNFHGTFVGFGKIAIGGARFAREGEYF